MYLCNSSKTSVLVLSNSFAAKTLLSRPCSERFMAPLTIHVKKRNNSLKRIFWLMQQQEREKQEAEPCEVLTVRAAISVFSARNPHKTCRVEQSCLHQHARYVNAKFMIYISSQFNSTRQSLVITTRTTTKFGLQLFMQFCFASKNETLQFLNFLDCILLCI
jgi:hypothetical protein